MSQSQSHQQEQEVIIYQQDQVLWAKIRGYPWWPAFVDIVHGANQQKEIEYTVFFFGDNTHSRLGGSKLRRFFQYYTQFYPKAKTNRKLNLSIMKAQQKLKQNGGNIEIFQKLRNSMKKLKKGKPNHKTQSKIGSQDNSNIQNIEFPELGRHKTFPLKQQKQLKQQLSEQQEQEQEQQNEQKQKQKIPKKRGRKPKKQRNSSKSLQSKQKQKQKIYNEQQEQQNSKNKCQEQQQEKQEQSEQQQQKQKQQIGYHTRLRRTSRNQQHINNSLVLGNNKKLNKKQQQSNDDEQQQHEQQDQQQQSQRQIQTKDKCQKFFQNIRTMKTKQIHRNVPKKRGRPKKSQYQMLGNNNNNKNQESQSLMQNQNQNNNSENQMQQIQQKPNNKGNHNNTRNKQRQNINVNNQIGQIRKTRYQRVQRQTVIQSTKNINYNNNNNTNYKQGNNRLSTNHNHNNKMEIQNQHQNQQQTQQKQHPLKQQILERIKFCLDKRQQLIQYLDQLNITPNIIKQILDLQVSKIILDGEHTVESIRVLQKLKSVLLHKYFPDDIKFKKKYQKINKKSNAYNKSNMKQQQTLQDLQLRRKTIIKLQKILRTIIKINNNDNDNEQQNSYLMQLKQKSIEIQSHFRKYDQSIGNSYKTMAYKVLRSLKDKSQNIQDILQKLEKGQFQDE